MTTREAGDRLGVTDRRILQFVKEGRLGSQRAGRIHLIRRADVERLAKDLIEEAPHKRGPKPGVMRQQVQAEEGKAEE